MLPSAEQVKVASIRVIPCVSLCLNVPQGVVLIQRWRLTSIRISIIKIRLSRERLIFVMEIIVPGKTVFILRWGPDVSYIQQTLIQSVRDCIHLQAGGILISEGKIFKTHYRFAMASQHVAQSSYDPVWYGNTYFIRLQSISNQNLRH